MITEWKDLEGRTIKKAIEFFLGGTILVFEDGEIAHIAGRGEERHGGHWPVLTDEDEEFVLQEVVNASSK